MVDIGAGCGEEALALSQAVGDSGRVIAVEADPATFKRLELLCRVNHGWRSRHTVDTKEGRPS